MEIDFLTWLLIAIIVVWCAIISYVFWARAAKRNYQEDQIEDSHESFEMVEIAPTDIGGHYIPALDDLDIEDECVQSEDEHPMALEDKSDFDTFTDIRTSPRRLRESLLNLINSGMTVIDMKGNVLTAEQILEEAGEAEEVISDDIISTQQRRHRINNAIKQLSNRKGNPSTV